MTTPDLPDLTAISADDALLDLLAAWRADIEAEPLPTLVDVDTALSLLPPREIPSLLVRIKVPLAVLVALLNLALLVLLVLRWVL